MQVSMRDKSSDRCRKIPIIAQGINVIMTVEILAFYISLSFFMKFKKEAHRVLLASICISKVKYLNKD